MAVSKLLQAMSGHPLLPEQTTLAVQAFIGASALQPLAFMVVELYPKAKAGYGACFGLALLLLTHESTLPYFGLSLP